MAIGLSNALLNYVNQQGSLKHALTGGRLYVYSGSKPATPQVAPSGTLLCTYTAASGTPTAEVLATGSVTLATGASGSVDTITVDSVDLISAPVPFNTSLAQTAMDVITAINNNSTSPKYIASSGGSGIVTLTASRGAGVEANGLVVAATGTTITFTTANMSGGVNPVNGLSYGVSSAGTLSKQSSQVWSGTAVASGTAGWGRLVGGPADSLTTDSTDSQVRLDFTIGTSGADLVLSPSTSMASGSTQTITNFSLTLPSA